MEMVKIPKEEYERLKKQANIDVDLLKQFLESFRDVKNHTLKCMACPVLEHAQDLFLLSHELK